LRAAAFRAVALRRVVFLRAGLLRAVVFLRRVVFLRAVPFLRAVFLRAVPFLRAVFLRAGFLRAPVFLAVDLRAAGLRAVVRRVRLRAVAFLRPAVFLAATPGTSYHRHDGSPIDPINGHSTRERAAQRALNVLLGLIYHKEASINRIFFT
jgi:hypothetical protein